jgi:hypothetical protein
MRLTGDNMLRSQKFTPKYWVIHDPESDDIIIETASKSAEGAAELYHQWNACHYSDDDMELILISIDLAIPTKSA